MGAKLNILQFPDRLRTQIQKELNTLDYNDQRLFPRLDSLEKLIAWLNLKVGGIH